MKNKLPVAILLLLSCTANMAWANPIMLAPTAYQSAETPTLLIPAYDPEHPETWEHDKSWMDYSMGSYNYSYLENEPIWFSLQTVSSLHSLYDKCEWFIDGKPVFTGTSGIVPGMSAGMYTVEVYCESRNSVGDPWIDGGISRIKVATKASVVTDWTVTGPDFVSRDQQTWSEGRELARTGSIGDTYVGTNGQWLYLITSSMRFLLQRPSIPLYPFETVPYDYYDVRDEGRSTAMWNYVVDSTIPNEKVIVSQHMQIAEPDMNRAISTIENEWIGLLPGEKRTLDLSDDFADEAHQYLKNYYGPQIATARPPVLMPKGSYPIVIGPTVEVTGATSGTVRDYTSAKKDFHANGDTNGISYRVVTLNPSYPYFDIFSTVTTSSYNKGVLKLEPWNSYWRGQFNAINPNLNYDVYVKYTANAQNDPKTTYRIQTAAGEKAVVVNQTVVRSGYYKLGTFRLPPTARITLDNSMVGKIITFNEIKVQKSATQ